VFLNGRETLEPTKVLHLWAKSQKDVDYTLQWQRSGVPDESSSSTWRFSVVLTPTPKSTKARAGDNQPMCFRCVGLEGSGYEFNNPIVAMDVLSTWVLYQQGKAAERCCVKLLKPYQNLWHEWDTLARTLGRKISSLLEASALASESDGCSVNTGYSGATENLSVHETRHFSERKQERGVPDLDYKRVLKYGQKQTFRQDIVKYCLEGVVVITQEGVGGAKTRAITTWRVEDWFSRNDPLELQARHTPPSLSPLLFVIKQYIV